MQAMTDCKLDLLVPKVRVYSPMLDALVKGNAKHVKLMLKVGTDPNQKDALGRTPLIMVSYYTDERKAISLADYIIKLGGKIDHADNNGKNALHHACEKGRVNLAEFLLKHRDDFDVFAKDGEGKTCADYINGKENEEMLRRLKSMAVEYGLDPAVFEINIKVPSKQTSLHRNREKPKQAHQIKYNGVQESSTIYTGRNGYKHQFRAHKATENGEYGNKQRILKETEVTNRKQHPLDDIGRRRKSTDVTIVKRRESSTDKTTKKCEKLFTRTLICEKHRLQKNFSSNQRGGASYRNAKDVEASFSQKKSRKVNTERGPKPKKQGSSKECLMDILKIYEKQNSELYRVGAKEKEVDENFDNPSAVQSPFDFIDEEIQRIPSGRASRSMSLVPGSLPSIAAMRKRRSSRVSLQGNKPFQINVSEINNRPNSLRQRRFSSITAATFSPITPSPENLNPRSGNVLSLSASNISLIKKLNAESSGITDATNILGNVIKNEERKGTTSEKISSVRSRNIQKKVSSLPSLQAFVETGEHIEDAESQ